MNWTASRHFLPLTAGIVGLCAGVLGPSLFQSNPPEQPAAPTSTRHRSAERVAKSTASPIPRGATSQLIRNLETASAADCQQLVNAIHEAQQTGKEIELEAIFSRWLKSESIDAILSHLETLDGRRESSWNTALFRAWVATDEHAAMNRRNHHNVFITARALFAIESANPSFTDYFEGTQNSFTFKDRAVAALTLLARDRPEVAMLVGTAEIHQELKADAITAVAKGWASRDPAAALAWLQSIDASGDAINAVFLEWAKLNPTDAAAAMQASGQNVELRNGEINRNALNFLLNPNDTGNRIALAILSDPFLDVEAVHRLLMEAGTGSRSASFSFSQDAWYPPNIPTAVLQANALPPGDARDRLLEALLRDWSYADLQAAAAFAKEHGLESRSITNLTEMTIPPGLREAAIASPAETFAPLFQDPTLTGPTRDHLVTLAAKWAERDPAAAAHWLAQQLSTHPQSQDSTPAEHLSRMVGLHWSMTDPLAAIQWVESLPDEKSRSAIWSIMQARVDGYSPDLAFQRSAAWLEGDRRMGVLRSSLSEIVRKIGKPAAADALRSAALSAEERTTLSATLNPAPGEPSR